MSIPFNKSELTVLLQSFTQDATHFYESIREHPVIPPDLLQRVAALAEDPLVEQGLGLTHATIALKENILPGLAYTAGPRAFPWVVGGGNASSINGYPVSNSI